MKELSISEAMRMRKVNQTFVGWGTSLSWWANVIGRWQSEQKKKMLCDLIFSVEKGLGLNLVRYNFGAGQPKERPTNFRVGANIENYAIGPDDWRMERDSGQRWILFEAIKRGVNITEAFFNSPPKWLLSQPSTAGATYGQANLPRENEVAFIDYVVMLLRKFEQYYGLRFDSISLFNEPSSMWWQSDNDQEGCHYSLASQERLVLMLADKIKAGEVYPLTISGPEGWSVFESVSMYNDLSVVARQAIGQLNSHTYLADNRARKALNRLAERDDKMLWMSEVCLAKEGQQEPEAMATGLMVARAIIDDLKYMKPVAWVYWQVIEDMNLGHNYGFIQAGYDQREIYHMTRSYYIFKQFTHYIRPGMRLIDIDEEAVIVAYNAGRRELVWVVLNEAEQEQEWHLRVETKVKAAQAVLTSADQTIERQAIEFMKDGQGVICRQVASSVLTVIITLED